MFSLTHGKTNLNLGIELCAAAATCKKWCKIITEPTGVFSGLYQKANLGPVKRFDTWAQVFKGFRLKRYYYKQTHLHCEDLHQQILSGEFKESVNGTEFNHALTYGYDYLAKAIFELSLSQAKITNSGCSLLDTAIKHSAIEYLPALLEIDIKHLYPPQLGEHVFKSLPTTWFKHEAVLTLLHKVFKGVDYLHILATKATVEAVKAAYDAGFIPPEGFKTSLEARLEPLLFLAEHKVIPSIHSLQFQTAQKVCVTLDRVFKDPSEKEHFQEFLMMDLLTKRTRNHAYDPLDAWLFQIGLYFQASHSSLLNSHF